MTETLTFTNPQNKLQNEESRERMEGPEDPQSGEIGPKLLLFTRSPNPKPIPGSSQRDFAASEQGENPLVTAKFCIFDCATSCRKYRNQLTNPMLVSNKRGSHSPRTHVKEK